MPKKKDISILDVTIRDGSYAIDYQYTPEKVASVAGALDEAGIDYIEVSHGCGLGAGKNLGFAAAATDAEYVRAARGAVKHAKIGVIAGPAPTTYPKDIDSIIHDVDFIRFAANSDDPEIVHSNIKHAFKKRKDIQILFQLMRSSRRPKKSIIAAARQVEDMGADTMYLVDTAGHFLPEEVGDIISDLTAKVKIRIGFHGHNNLGLAIANTLAAVEAGATSVDASLRGIGRSAGNAQLEALVSLLHRKGLLRHVDLDSLLIAGDTHIEPIMPSRRGIASIDVIMADANIDLYPLSFYERVSHEANVNLIDLIGELGGDREVVEVGRPALKKALGSLGCKDPEAAVNLANAAMTSGTEPEAGKKHKAGSGAAYNVVLALKTAVKSMDFSKELENWLIEQFPDVHFHTTGFSEKKIDHLDKADILFAYTINPRLLAAAPKLKWFHSVLAGIETSTFPELAREKVIVTASRGVYSIPVSETTIGMMLALSRKIRDAIVLQTEKKIDAAKIVSSRPPMTELAGSTALIVGMGGIGTAVASRCRALDMCVIGVVSTPRPKSDVVDEQIIFERLNEVLGLADFVILTCPLTEETRGMIGENELRAMKPGAFLINVARGDLVDEIALANALKKGSIGGAACDVFAVEPLPADHPLYKAPNMLITPHIAGLSMKFWSRATARFAANLQLFLEGKPLIDEVDFKRGY